VRWEKVGVEWSAVFGASESVGARIVFDFLSCVLLGYYCFRFLFVECRGLVRIAHLD
jgi:hypothetical protein